MASAMRCATSSTSVASTSAGRSRPSKPTPRSEGNPMASARAHSLARLVLVSLLAVALDGAVTLLEGEARDDVAVAAVRDQNTTDQLTSAPRGVNALQDAAERAGQIGRV